jgi:hypothetical protein
VLDSRQVPALARMEIGEAEPGGGLGTPLTVSLGGGQAGVGDGQPVNGVHAPHEIAAQGRRQAATQPAACCPVSPNPAREHAADLRRARFAETASSWLSQCIWSARLILSAVSH